MTGETTPRSTNSFSITPPLLNSANPWATTKADLKALYDCAYTGAVTIRTSLWGGFKHDPGVHQYTFFSSSVGRATAKVDSNGSGEVVDGETSSLNTLGYSPVAFKTYMSILVQMSRSGSLGAVQGRKEKDGPKPFIVSVTGTAEEVAKCCGYMLMMMNEPWNVFQAQNEEQLGLEGLDLMMEVNLSCPNIPDKPPPAYDGVSLTEYITAIGLAKLKAKNREYAREIHVGIKTPPYTYHGQFKTLIDALEQSSALEGGCPISFITATNTLGSCLVLDGDGKSALDSANGMGIGGMAGDALHPIALGNVKTIRTLLDGSQYADVKGIQIIGVGGVKDRGGYERMVGVGAVAVGVGTALGRDGVDVFEKIARK